MRAKFVNESLDRFALLDNDFLAENVLNEKLDINTIANKSKKLGVLASMFLMFAVGKAPELQSKLPSKDKLENSPLMINMAEEDHLSRDDVFNGFEDILNLYKPKEEKRIMSVADEGFIDSVNDIQPGRLDSTNIERYDKFDNEILSAVDTLNAKGEDANADFIKAIMLIETGMNPVKNKWGFEGFPQTKQWLIDAVNKKYDTKFTLKGIYNAYEAAQFIHYFVKMIEKNGNVDSLEDVIIAYNWGTGNLGKWKRGEKDLPLQSSNYVKFLNAMQTYFVS